MFIKTIKLVHFRNYENIEIKFDPALNVIYGNNAQGKTNILEAIFICASGRSHRTAKDQEMIQFGQDSYYIKVHLEKEERDAMIEVSYRKEEKKHIKINEIKQSKIGKLMGNLNAVIFSPEDLLIIKEGPSERRKFIDISISQLKPSYFFDLQQYAKVLEQRNTLLKEIQFKKSLIDTLEIWNIKMATLGSRIMSTRKEFISKLNKKVIDNHQKLTNKTEMLNILYNPSIQIGQEEDLSMIETNFLNVLKQNEGKELSKGMTLFGPQRDDYEFWLNGNNLKLYGSQGQQRTAILSLKLSEIDIIKEETDEYPVLLLDDVLSELDEKRQDYLFDNLEGIQTFITCTDKNFFTRKDEKKTKYYHIKQGIVENIE